MTTPSNHNREIVSQFTKQAIPFTRLSGHVDALETLVEMSKANSESRVLDVASGLVWLRQPWQKRLDM